MSDPKLSNCRCGKHAVFQQGGSGGWYARCHYARCWYGPERDTKEDAAEAWNAALRADAAGEAREIIESLAIQFSYDGPHGKISTGGLSALESAFAYLGWDDPRPLPDELLCDEPKCHERSTSGWRDGDRYRRTCQKHWHPPAPEVKA